MQNTASAFPCTRVPAGDLRRLSDQSTPPWVSEVLVEALRGSNMARAGRLSQVVSSLHRFRKGWRVSSCTLKPGPAVEPPPQSLLSVFLPFGKEEGHGTPR